MSALISAIKPPTNILYLTLTRLKNSKLTIKVHRNGPHPIFPYKQYTITTSIQEQQTGLKKTIKTYVVDV